MIKLGSSPKRNSLSPSIFVGSMIGFFRINLPAGLLLIPLFKHSTLTGRMLI
ncbi:hypothetical protein LEP1GSC045_0352 [Leptospira interrogans serovar Pomona str. Kennewicki LC82-25]|nr:hypothetical protein LEP1GSC045_0352 [Leptospira interrogans serovar Pomona str. Kennewicki LC82-25]EKN97089.1 hypothetical protein LEP1GSC014_0026 [Leptospira interrogans serovar Pomona str. Pomona]EMF34722.1 hypothetical protein LEP1GSC201_3889 [Leptospira interrogans serovar Pomona str. Fox 32256]EMJ57957.1 hypothetical protein LEP1GSC197_4388 [Leptospira interrogans serovar Pomona str. CSL4002]